MEHIYSKNKLNQNMLKCFIFTVSTLRKSVYIKEILQLRFKKLYTHFKVILALDGNGMNEQILDQVGR